jgi:hypothetical protein
VVDIGRMVIVAIWTLVALLIGLYVLFVVWRLRVDRRKKAMQSGGDTATSVSSVIARAASSGPPTGVVSAAAPTLTPPPSPSPSPTAVMTVAEALAGIVLPHGLAPLTTMAWREGVVDRVAFWTSVPAEVVGPAFGDELERLGYTVSPLDDSTLAAQRPDARLIAIIHPDGHRATIGQAQAFESVPELATVIEIWIPLI